MPVASAAKRCVKGTTTSGSLNGGTISLRHSGQSGQASDAPVFTTVAPSSVKTRIEIAEASASARIRERGRAPIRPPDQSRGRGDDDQAGEDEKRRAEVNPHR